jgi:N-acetyl-1-D-myo-inositol-2-amino-2-deoxy-alpha-D-glucopyranoside deacetylase
VTELNEPPSDAVEIQRILASATRILALHAHPDDESLSSGGTLAMLASRGADVSLVTGTRGERGEVVEGPLKPLAGTDGMAALRERELAAAVTTLGIGRHRFLGADGARAIGKAPRSYVDSGMIWRTPDIAAAAPDAPPDALSIADLDEVTADIRAAVSDIRPDLIITYNAHGGYGHPDHVRMHDAGVLAAHASRTQLLLIESEEVSTTQDGSSPGAVLEIDIRPWLPRKIAALASHASQLTIEGDHYVLSGGQRHLIDSVERFRLVRP